MKGSHNIFVFNCSVSAVCRVLLVGAILTSAMFCINGCIETIDFNVNRSGNNLVVDGMITDAPGPHTLKLRRTSDLEKISDPMGGATILISDNMGNSEYYYETTEGTYELEGETVTGVPGRSYHIEIMLDNSNIYRSEPEVMPAEIARDTIYYEFDTIEVLNSYGNSIEKDVVRVIKNSTVPATDEPLYLKWEVQEVYKFSEYDFPDPFNNPPPSCYITGYPAPQTIHLYDGSELSDGPLEPEHMVERELDDTFYQRHYLNVIQYSITQKAHEYWTKVDQVVNRSGTIFDVPPANARSNIKNVNNPEETVLGYFHAAAIDSSRIFLNRFDLPVNIFNPCNIPSGPDCLGGCSKFDNSSPEPPAWWLDDLGSGI